jgi:hypothetical protein
MHGGTIDNACQRLLHGASEAMHHDRLIAEAPSRDGICAEVHRT